VQAEELHDFISKEVKSFGGNFIIIIKIPALCWTQFVALKRSHRSLKIWYYVGSSWMIRWIEMNYFVMQELMAETDLDETCWAKIPDVVDFGIDWVKLYKKKSRILDYD